MPIEHVHPIAVYPRHRYGLIQPRGPVSAASTIRTGLALVALPGWEPGFDEVWDLRFTDEYVIDPSDIPRLRDLEAATRTQLAGSRTIMITGGRPLLAYAAQFYDGLVRPLGRSALACKTIEEALHALRVDHIPLLKGYSGDEDDADGRRGTADAGSPREAPW